MQATADASPPPPETAAEATAALAAATAALGPPPPSPSPSPSPRRTKAAAAAAATAATAEAAATPPPTPLYPYAYAPPVPYPPAAAAAAGFSAIIYSLRNCFLALNDSQFESEVEIERTRRRFYSTSTSTSDSGKKPAPTAVAPAAGDKKRAAAAAASTTEIVNVDNEDSSNTNDSNKKQKTSKVAVAAAAATTTPTTQGLSLAGEAQLVLGGSFSSAWSYASYFPPPYYYHHPPPPPPAHTAADAATAEASVHYDPHHYQYPIPLPQAAAPAPAAAAKRKPKKKKQRQQPVASSTKKKTAPQVPPGKRVVHWNDQYEQLKAFHQEYGHVSVPNKMSKELSSLHNWLRRTKEAWRRQVVYKEPSACPLTQEQMQKLVNLGVGTSIETGPINFADHAIATDWDERFAELVKFKNENGHTDVSDFKHKDTHNKLAVWVINQRKNFQNRQAIAAGGKKKFPKSGVMTEEQMLKFASIGFRFSHVLKNIDERIVQLQDFKKVHGHTQVPYDCTEYSGLGLWVKKTRDAYAVNKLSASRIEKLNAIEFDWSRGQRRSNSSQDHQHHG